MNSVSDCVPKVLPVEAEGDVLRHSRPCDFAKGLGVEDEQSGRRTGWATRR
jgi:hypothetical protein